METNTTDQLFAVFYEAQKIPVGAERERYLSLSCHGDEGFRANVVSLLAADEIAGDFLEPSTLFSADPATQEQGELVGRFKLGAKIGEGGCGVVYLADQERPVRRRVALKIIKLGMDTRQVVARFEAERQALAMMDHPNIAHVFDAGATSTGRPYFAMELVPGEKITAFCDTEQLDLEARLRLFMDVCGAIQHAHQKGIIHRDIKPSNVLVSRRDGDHVPKVIDFGIAKATEGNLSDFTVFTARDQFIGTPAYISPEQAQLSAPDVDTRSDIYSLGALLYELLTGCTPFDSASFRQRSLDELRRAIRETEPIAPSARLDELPAAELHILAAHRGTEPAKLRNLVRGDLDAIVMKCLEKDRSRRYPTASDLAADLQRHLGNEPILARPPSTAYRLQKAWRRNKVAFAAALAIVAASLIALAALAVSILRIRQAQQDTENALVAEIGTKGKLEVNSYFQSVALAHRELSADNLGGALKHLVACPEPLRGWEWNYLNRLGRFDPVVLRHEHRAHALAFHPDGKKIAVGSGDGTVKIWDLASRKIIQTLPCQAKYVFSVAFRPPDGRFLASAGADRLARVWDWAAAREVFHVPGPSAEYRGLSTTLAFSADGRHLIADRGDGLATSWDADTGAEARVLNGKHEVAATCVEESANGELLATGSWGGVLRIWNARTGALLHHARDHTHRISGVCFESQGRWLATASYDRLIKIWDTQTARVLRSWEGSGGLISALALSPDGRRLASCGVEDKMVRVWDPATGREILSLRGHTAMVHGIAFSPNGQRLASCSHDGTVRLWDATPLAAGEKVEFRTSQHDAEVWSVAFSPDGQFLASGSWDNTARIWDAQTGRLARELPHSGSVFHVAFDAAGRLVTSAFTAQRTAVVTAWDLPAGREVFSLREKAYPFCVALDPTGEYLLREGEQFRMRIWNTRSRADAGVLGQHEFNIWSMCFSPDGAHVATGSSDGFIRLWPWRPGQFEETREPVWKAPGRFLGYGDRIAFSPSGDRLFAGGESNTVQILDPKTGKVIGNLAGHTGEVWAVAVDPGGRWLATAGEDTTIRIWDAQSGQLLRALRGHTGFVMSLAFSPDGLTLASGSRDCTVKSWHTAGWGETAAQ